MENFKKYVLNDRGGRRPWLALALSNLPANEAINPRNVAHTIKSTTMMMETPRDRSVVNCFIRRREKLLWNLDDEGMWVYRHQVLNRLSSSPKHLRLSYQLQALLNCSQSEEQIDMRASINWINTCSVPNMLCPPGGTGLKITTLILL